MFLANAARLLGSLALVLSVAVPAGAQTPNTSPTWAALCDDCFGTERFGQLTPAASGGCQNYQHNLYENWTAEGTSSPDPKFLTAALADIVEVNQTSDANFWYYQVVTRAANWNSVLLPRANVEMAFGDCTDAATRYRLVLIYDVDSADVGTTWRAQGGGKVKYFRDNSSGNNRIGDIANDGPAAPAGNTSNFDSNDDGYETSVSVAAADTYTRLATSGGRATVEFAVRRTAATLLAVANPFTPCFGRAWTVQSSSLSEAQFAVNDQRPTSDFTSTSWAIDSCNQPADAGACDPAPDCTAFHTPCATASCDAAGADGNCNTLTPVSAGTTCRASTGVCDPLEQCDGVATTCPSDTLLGGATTCRPNADVCDTPESCTGTSGACPIDAFLSAANECRGSADVCDTAESCTGTSAACPIDAFASAATVCRASGGVCDIAESCTGSSAGCPSDSFLGTTTTCRTEAVECDAAEVCSGAGPDCPADLNDPDGTACGSGLDTVCDDPDTCSGGACVTNNEPASTLCRGAAGDCDVAESCDGAGACPADAFEPAETACGSASDTVCDNADTCDGSGTCDPNHEPGSTVCRADAGQCDVEETCDGAGNCPADAFETDGTACGNPGETVCDKPDTCSGGACVTNNEPASTLCRDAAGECDVAENCDGAGACPDDAFVPADTACGSASDTVCDNADTCDGSGNCQPNNEPAATLCRDAAGECDVAENCDGAGACPADAFEPADTACGSASDTVCDNADRCDGNGACDPNNEPGTTLCRDDAGECDVAENCDGAGACPADGFEPAGTACGSASDTVCDNADTCDGSGNCEPNNEPPATLCRDAAGECDVAENCDGAGACPADAFEPAETACGSASDTLCDNADTCDGSGNCDPNNESAATLCRDDAGECDVAENCDGAGACPADAFEPADTACGSASDTACDNADTCDGNGACDPNNEPGTTVCRDDAGECDVAENCDGAGACPADAFEPVDTACGSASDTVCDNADTCDGSGNCQPNNEPGTTVCREATDVCDVTESCDGAGECPADSLASTAAECREAAGPCDEPESCNGVDAACPADLIASEGAVCRDAAGSCDIVETCDGVSIECGPDAVEVAETPCREVADVCDVAESCDGTSAECPADEFEPSSLECRGSADVCDVGESCTGTSASCPDDGFAASNVLCRASTAQCDSAELCTGAGTACPADVDSPNGSPCNDSNACTDGDNCDDGECNPGDPVVCDDGDLCTFDTCDVQEGCQAAPDLREPETCYNSEAGRLVVTDRTIVRKDSIRWTWRRGETMADGALGDPGGTTAYSVCVFDLFEAEPRLATSIAIPAGPSSFWKKVAPTRFRYIDPKGTQDGLRRFVARMSPKPNRSKLVVRARGLGVPLPEPVDASQLFDLDPSVVVQVISSDDVCWSSEFTLGETQKNVPLKYRGRFR